MPSEANRSQVRFSGEELGHAAGVLLEELLKLRKDEKLLVYADRGGELHAWDAIRARAADIGARTEFLELDDALELEDLALQLSRHIRAGRFDAVCELSTKYFYRTRVARAIRDVGARAYWLPGLDSEAFNRCVGAVDHRHMFAFGMALRRVLRQSKHLRVLTDRGTDLRMRIGQPLPSRLASRLVGRQRPKIWRPAGLFDKDIRSTFLGGQLCFQALTETIQGTAVVDGYLWPPREIGRLGDPIHLTVKQGRVVGMDGSASRTRLLSRWFERQEIGVEHFCMGFHPTAGLAGQILEAERAFGCISIGLGRGRFHTDGVMTFPTIEMDGTRLEERGSFVYGELPSLEEELLHNPSTPAHNRH
jgi:2,5-dihydroxypyridine 5,6-dioxygenase